MPSWHEKQLPMTWVWSTRVAGRHPDGEWQDSQVLLDWMWLEPLPVAFTPLWQLEQLTVIPAWLKPVAGFQAVVAWQLPHSAAVAMCGWRSPGRGCRGARRRGHGRRHTGLGVPV